MSRLLCCLQATAALACAAPACAALAGAASGALPPAAPLVLPAAVACGQHQLGKAPAGMPVRPVLPPGTSVHVHCAYAPPGPGTPPPAPAPTPAPAPAPTPAPPSVVLPTVAAASTAHAASAGKARFGDDWRDGPVLVALFTAMAFTVVGLGLLSSALGWPRTGAAMRHASAEGPDPAAPGEGFAFRRHWGSFGAESTGWAMSSGLARLMAGLGLIALAVILLLVLMSDPPGKQPDRVPVTTATPPAPVKSALLPAGG